MNINTNIWLCNMTKTLNRIYFRKYEHDPDLYEDLGNFRPYRYNTTKSGKNRKRQRDLGRVHLAIMHGIVPVGEVILKNIDPNQCCCTLGIHLRNDSVKNKGYFSAAEIQAMQYDSISCSVKRCTRMGSIRVCEVSTCWRRLDL